MSSATSTISAEKIEKMCREALEKFQAIGGSEYNEIQSKLHFVIASYNYDKNPVGLYEIGQMALDLLKEYKEKNPKKVTKKLIDDLEKAIKEKQA